MNILLMGLRGSGKTTVGRMLAETLGRRFVDLDQSVLESFSAATVHDVWSSRGEPAWRAAEARVLETILHNDGLVVALGGGTPMIGAARRVIEAEQLRERAAVIYLRCTVAELARRLTGETADRPSLTGRDPVEEIGDVLAAREPTFRRLADLERDVTGVTPEQIVEMLTGLLRRGG